MFKPFSVFILCILSIGLFTCNSQAIASRNKNVLILHSYHQGYKWTDDQNQGIIDRLDKMKGDLQIFTEYMGTKWASDEPYFEKLSQMYKAKYVSTHFNLIIATDNDTFNFLRHYRDDVFGETPVVFCGVNWFKPEQIKDNTLYTGVNEDSDIGETLDLMMHLHPATKHIFVIADLTTTGNIVHDRLDELIPEYRDKVTLHILDNLELEEILHAISTLPPNSLVLLTVFQKDNKGVFLDAEEIASRVSTKSNVPVYGLWEFYLGYGIVGGLLTSGYSQGESAGGLALRILNGESPASIPVVMESPNKYMFDFKQLTRFDIKISDLPAGNKIINKPDSFYNIDKGVFWSLIVGISLLATMIVILLINIRGRSRAEQSLKTSEEKYRSLVDNLPLGVYRSIGQPEGVFLQVNPAMARIFGYESAEELMNLPISEFYLNADERKLFFKELVAKGFVKNKEILLSRKNGKSVWISINAKAHYNGLGPETGKMIWTDVVVEDITEKKKLEQKLRQAQKMEALGTFAGGIAHDFNNLLTGIIGYACLLKMEMDKNVRHRDFTDQILAVSERAASLTKNLLAFSRKQEIETRAVNINEIILHFTKFMTRMIGEDIELKIVTAPEAIAVMADRGQIEQVLMNLATNAKDAMPNGGGINITTRLVELDNEDIQAYPSLKTGEYVEIIFSDTGSGMDEATRQRIFEPFFTTKDVDRGTGLGLSIIYGIIQQHNGEIIVSSEAGKGTTFKIYLPVLKAGAEGRKEPVSTPFIGGNECILLIEDDAIVRKLQKEVLGHLGYTIIVAEDGQDGISKFVENRDSIQLLLLDVIMPKKNGREVYEEIKKIKPDIKVLFISGYTADIISRQGILEKGQQFLTKPTTPGVLARKLREILDAKE